jgi:sigma-B regulation protein RsbU (phosphoserine phosphatase)
MTIIGQEWLKQVEDILEILNEGVGITDDTGHVLFVNECMERLLDAPRAALIGKTADAFYSGEEYEFTLERMARIGAIGYDRYEFFIPRTGGTRVPVIISAREIEAPDGSPFMVFTCTDISQQKKAEQSLREANAQLESRAEEIDRELAIASQVQKSLAPQPVRWGRVAVETFYKPVRTIGGDFGLVLPFDGTHLDLLVCDISGHGISSALLANRVYTETVSLLRHGMELDEMLRTLNHFVIQYMRIDGFIFTMASARLDLSGRQLIYAAAGHPPAFLISSSGEVRRVEPLSTVLGRLAEAVPEKAIEEFKLSAGDRLMLYSDALIEVWNDDGEILGVEGLERIVRKAAGFPLPAMREAIIEGVNSYSAGPLHDDVTLILAEIR